MSTHREPRRSVSSISEDESAFEAGLRGIEARLRSTHPELFDETGELRAEDAMRLLTQRTGGQRDLTDSELLALAGQRPELQGDAP